MWKNKEVGVNAPVSIHDCEATNIKFDGEDLVFEFEDGIWISPDNENNPYDKLLGTDKAEMRFKKAEIYSVYLYKRIGPTRKLSFTKRIIMDIEKVMDKVNCGKWELEFTYGYHNTGRSLFVGGVN